MPDAASPARSPFTNTLPGAACSGTKLGDVEVTAWM
jgi:hypothetical protein